MLNIDYPEKSYINKETHKSGIKNVQIFSKKRIF